jgi:hypothetical protein
MSWIFLFLFPSLISLGLIHIAEPFKVVGWFNDETGIKDIPWDIYTHIVTGYPTLYKNGTVVCNKDDNLTQAIVNITHKNNALIQWRSTFIYDSNVLFNDTYKYKQTNYLNSLPIALKECNIDGIEFDYEWGYKLLDKLGIIEPYYSNKYTDFLENVKQAIAPKLVSADVGSWECCCESCGYPLSFLPWVNVSRFNNGAFDFVNVMSYHQNKNGDIFQWENDRYIFEELWHYNLSKVNMGIAYFSMNSTGFKITNEPTWNSLSYVCPNVDPTINVCNKLPFVGKQMNYDLGKFAVFSGFGGVFPWTLNYDSFHDNNTLITWLNQGIQSN